MGDTIAVQLDENPTTGFRWAPEQDNPDVLAPQPSEYTQAPGTGVGGGGRKRFVFEASKPGTCRLAFKLWREWEGDRSITQRFEVTIVVQS
jgi:inhibitor of cysteine peptidase